MFGSSSRTVIVPNAQHDSGQMNNRTLITIVSVTVSRIMLLSIWFAALILIYRTLGKTPEGLAEAGYFAFAMTTIRLFVSWIGDTLDLEVMRRVPMLIESDRPAAFAAWRAATAIRLAAALLVGAVLIAVSEPLGRIFMDAQNRWILWYCGAGTMAEVLIRAELSYLQASESYYKFLKLEGLWQAIRFLAIAVLAAAGYLDGHSAVAAYVGSSVAAAVIGVIVLPRGLVWPFTLARSDVISVLNYIKWIVPALGVAAFSERIDLYLIKYFQGAAAAGLYGAVLSLALIPDAISGFLATTLQPRITRLHRDGKFLQFFAWFSWISLPLGLAAIILTVVLGEWVVNLLLGVAYAPAAPAFILMAIATLFWLALTPLPLSLIALVRPQLLFKITVVSGIAGIGLRIFMIPWLGLMGAAISLLILRSVLAIFLVAASRRMHHDIPEPPSDSLAQEGDVAKPVS